MEHGQQYSRPGLTPRVKRTPHGHEVQTCVQSVAPSLLTMSEATLNGDPEAPSCKRTFTMSMGWMMVVAIMPDSPPFTNGLARSHADGAFGISVCFVSGMVSRAVGTAQRRSTRRPSQSGQGDRSQCEGPRKGLHEPQGLIHMTCARMLERQRVRHPDGHRGHHLSVDRGSRAKVRRESQHVLSKLTVDLKHLLALSNWSQMRVEPLANL